MLFPRVYYPSFALHGNQDPVFPKIRYPKKWKKEKKIFKVFSPYIATYIFFSSRLCEYCAHTSLVMAWSNILTKYNTYVCILIFIFIYLHILIQVRCILQKYEYDKASYTRYGIMIMLMIWNYQGIFSSIVKKEMSYDNAYDIKLWTI